MRCPTCGKSFEPVAPATLPFCSERCRTVDLGRWLDEKHSVPVVKPPDEEAEADGPAAADDE
jgi:uncharacterized protein